MNILKIKDPQGNWVDIPALKGDKGDKGDPGISPTIDSTLSQANQAADAKAVGDALNAKANQNGYYENLNVGVADQLASKNYIEDNEAYTFRPTANGAKVGTREFDTIVGGSIVWNQLVDESTVSVTIPNTHNYIAKIDGAYTVAMSDETAITVTGGADEIFDITQMFGSTIADYIYSLEQAEAGAGVAWFRKYFPNEYYNYNPGELMHVSDLQSHDMVGLNLWNEEWEVGTIDNITGSNVGNPSMIRSKNYIPIVNATYRITCLFVSTAQTQSIGGRFYDIDKNYIGSVPLNPRASFTPPSNARYMRFAMLAWYGSTYKNDICINLSGTRNGEYEPYIKHSYPLDSSLTLRGIPKLVDGKLNFDGDIYKPDGTVKRRYRIVDLGTLNWAMTGGSTAENRYFSSPLNLTVASGSIISMRYTMVSSGISSSDTINMVMRIDANKMLRIRDLSYSTVEAFKTAISGVYLVYELAEPTIEQAQPYQSPQIIDPYGTEEYVTTSIVPVGHQTQYPEDLRAKIESLPWDFANLIAPVETTYIATQNYTAGSLFIIDNILYKATANIANGGTITPNTNCTATTLAEIIATL